MTVPFIPPAAWALRPSPNHSARRATVDAIVLHADASGSVTSSLDWVSKNQAALDALWEATPAARRPKAKYQAVSYHLMVGRTGDVFMVVNPDRRAWHAGVSVLDGRKDVNRFAVGVCLSNRNDGKEPYPEAQLASAAAVCVVLCRHYNIPTARITTHALISPGRKTDPLGLHLQAFRDRVTKGLARTAE